MQIIFSSKFFFKKVFDNIYDERITEQGAWIT